MTYFWCTSGEDGTRIEPVDREEVLRRLREVLRGDRRATFLTQIPSEDGGCWRAPEDAVVIIKGDVTVPKERVRITEYDLE